MKAFDNLPTDLFEAYNNAIERIETSRGGDKDLAMKVFSWIYYAQKTLKMDELLEALVMEDAEAEDDLEDIFPYMLAPGDIVECCKSLVSYDQSTRTVRFIHFTVEQFISRHLKERFPPAIMLATACLTYLKLAKFHQPCLDQTSMAARVDKYKFGCYASQYWAFHVRGKLEESLDIQCDVFKLFEIDAQKDAVIQLETYSSSPWRGIHFTRDQTLLHVFAGKGLATFCRLVLRRLTNTENACVPFVIQRNADTKVLNIFLCQNFQLMRRQRMRTAVHLYIVRQKPEVSLSLSYC